MGITQISMPENYANNVGEEFEYVLYHYELSPFTDYWQHSIEVKHAKWGVRTFPIFAAKKNFPTQELAEHLARTHGIDAVKGRLDEASSEGFPLQFPILFEGWWII